MEKKYEPKNFENKLYANWLDKGYFSAKRNPDKKPFTIILPPPNITGQLHIGHAMGATIQDAIIRYKRMKGFEALWLPGTDHASIATEVRIVEKMREEGLSKKDLGREKFLERAFEWYQTYGGRILQQLHQMGAGCDWSRLAFTMDEQRSRSVKEAFILLFEKGYIYRGNRIINWCPDCKTAISDAEVEYSVKDSHLYYIRYFIKDSADSVVVATTRPETILGDTAVAVNPNDKRYNKLVGKTLILPLANREIPIIADTYVEIGFGTGAVKITPAHDPNDYEVGLRHNLPMPNIMNTDATLNSLAGKYEGLSRDAARKQIIADLDAIGQLVKVEKYQHNVGHCHRCDNAIEPMLSKQWFVKMDELVKPAIDAVKKQDIAFLPKRFEKMYMHWMNNSKDWCISRQLWWGHRIPVFYCDKCGREEASVQSEVACPSCGKRMVQDEDVLDTWFSSALWPFSTLGWPNKTDDLKYFYPTNVLVTAYDIIGFWVSRMIFSGLEYMREKPFDTVLIHGIVRDELGRKMSKSLNNGVDPLEVIEKYGADTLRISLVSGVKAGKDIKYSADKQEGYRNFMNKIWNAARFILTNSEGVKLADISELDLATEDKWILGLLNQLINKVTKLMDKYEIGLASSLLYDFVWSQFCDWYIEFSKISLYSQDEKSKNRTLNVLIYVLRQLLKLMHPIVPFITEEIYLLLPGNTHESIVISDYPVFKSASRYSAAVKDINLVIDTIKSVRNLRNEMNVSQAKRTDIYVKPIKSALIKKTAKIIEKLAYGNSLIIVDEQPQQKSAAIITAIAEIYLPMSELVDNSKELERLQNELTTVESEIERAEGKLQNRGFTDKAPAKLIEAEREKLVKYKELKIKLQENISKLE